MKAYCKKSEVDGVIRVIATDETLDRSGESIPFESWDLTNFSKSPRLLIDHDYSVKSIVGKAVNVTKDATMRALTFEPVFHDITQVARDTKELVEQGFLDTVSVGFMRGEDHKGVVTNELMEVSFVAVPANANARVLSVKDISDDETKLVEDFVKADEVAKAEGDPCTMDDGSEGVMAMGENNQLVCMVPQKEKGMVSDVITAQDTMEQKCENMDEAWEILFALCDVYCKPETPVEAWAALVTEAGSLLAALATDPTAGEPATEGQVAAYLKTDEAKKSIKEKKSKRFISEEKSGRVLSQKNRDIISTTKDSLTSSIGALEELLKATEADTSEGIDEEKKVDKKESREDQSYQKFIELRKVTRAVNAAISDALKNAKLSQ